jgi:hypothetical protein
MFVSESSRAMSDQPRHEDAATRLARTRPTIEPLASRLERSARVHHNAKLTEGMLDELVARSDEWTVWPDVWVKGMLVPFLAVGPPGVFLIWAVDVRWTYGQAAMVMPARRQVQLELGEQWPGQAEAIFHAPLIDGVRERVVAVDEATGEPFDLVLVAGRIDEVLQQWEPAGGVWLDGDWLAWLRQAGAPRWWRSEEEADPRLRGRSSPDPE